MSMNKTFILLAVSLGLGTSAFAGSDGTQKKMYQDGCKTLLAKDFPNDRTVDESILDGFSGEKFIHLCEARAEHYLSAKPAPEMAGKKFLVGLVQTVCLGPVSPDLYKSQTDWVRNRIGCVRTMLEASGTQDLKTVAQYDVAPPGSRKPSSVVATDKDTLHRYEHQLNLILFDQTF